VGPGLMGDDAIIGINSTQNNGGTESNLSIPTGYLPGNNGDPAGVAINASTLTPGYGTRGEAVSQAPFLAVDYGAGGNGSIGTSGSPQPGTDGLIKYKFVAS